MLAARLALSRPFWRLQLQHHGAAHAARQQQQPARAAAVAAAAAAARRQHAMAAGDSGEGSPPGPLDASKRQVREEVKAALRALGAAQMAEESECECAGWARVWWGDEAHALFWAGALLGNPLPTALGSRAACSL